MTEHPRPRLLQRLWCIIWHEIWTVSLHPNGHYYKSCSVCGCWIETTPIHFRPPPAPPPFDWLRDYGPYWFPGTLAFWLDPETDEEIAAWRAKYEAPRQRDYLAGLNALAASSQYGMYQNAGMQTGLQNSQNQYRAYKPLFGVHRHDY